MVSNGFLCFCLNGWTGQRCETSMSYVAISFGYKVHQSFCYVRRKGLCFQIISRVEFRCGLTFLSGVRRKN